MGRKKGQQQRVKGNVLPSNSVRSADLLVRESVNAGLGLFQSLPSMALGNLPELSGLDSISSTKFRTALKKLYKRDVTTKLKALNELSGLCESAKQHEVLGMLPYWPRIYNRLFEDNDRRVRENTQKAMHAVVAAVGKNLAPQLKNLMGCWFVSQCDPFSPASLSAEAALDKAFSDDKKISAFAFCREDILGFISSFIFSPQAKKDKSEDEGNNFHRMVASCLAALSLYLRTVSNHKPSDDEIEVFLDNSSFWKFQKHSSSSVRAGYYSVLESICIICPILAYRHSSELCRSIFHRLDENNVNVCKSLYAAAVAASAKCDVWYSEIDLHKGLVAGVRNTLKMGCYGLGTYVLPSMLPIFANIPFDSDILIVFSKLFEALRLCIAHDSVKQSKRSTELAITSYMEILKLSVLRVSENIDSADIVRPFCDALVKEEMIAIIKQSWSDDGGRFLTRSVLEIIPSVIQSWESKVSDNIDVYRIVSDIFWMELTDVVRNQSFIAESPSMTERIIAFLHSLCVRAPSSNIKRSVKFEGTAEKDTCRSEETLVEDHEIRLPEERICASVDKMIVDCKLLFPLRVKKVMMLLQKTAYEKLGSENIFTELSKSLDMDKSCDRVLLFLNSMLIPEVLKICEEYESDREILVMLSTIISSVIKHCPKGSEFPCELSAFVSTENPASMTVLLQSLCELLSIADSKTGPWLKSLFNCNTVINSSEILQSVTLCATKCVCSTAPMKYILDEENCWKLLEKLVTVSYKDDSGCVVYICGPNLCQETVSFLGSTLNELKESSSCYESAIKKYANIMLAIVSREMEWPKENLPGTSENLWVQLITDLFELYFSAKDTYTILHLFEDLFTKAIQCSEPASSPFYLHLSKYLQSLGQSISRKLVSQEEYRSENLVVQNVLDHAKCMSLVVLKLLKGNDNVFSFLQAILPSSDDWDHIRKFDISSVKVDFTHNCILLPSQIEPSCSIIEAFIEIVGATLPHIDEYCEEFSWSSMNEYLQLLEESVLSSGISEHVTKFSELSSDVKKAIASRMVQKSVTLGGMWAFSLGVITDILGDEDINNVVDHFVSSFAKSEVNLALFQSIMYLERIPEWRLLEVLNAICEKLESQSPDEATVSDVYAFSFSLCAACTRETGQGPDIISRFREMVLKWKKANVHGFLDDDSEIFKEELVAFQNSVAKFYSYLISKFPEMLLEEDWDFIQCALLSWIESIAKHSWQNTEVSAMVLALLNGSCKLLKVVIHFMSSSIAIEDPAIPSNLVSEWRGFFSNAINSSLVKIFIDLRSRQVSRALLTELCECVRYATADSVLASAAELNPKLTANSILPDDVQTVVNHLCSSLCVNRDILTDDQRYLVGVTSYHLLVKILDRLSSQDSDCAPDEILTVLHRLYSGVVGSFDADEIEIPKSSRASSDESDLEDIDEENSHETAVNSTLRDSVESNAVSVTLYLLAWRTLIKLTKFISPEKKIAYVVSIMKHNNPNISENLLPQLFRIMVGKKSHFIDSPNLYNSKVDFELIQRISACLYKEFLIEMPAASRSWFNDLPKVVRSRVDKFTASNVSPVLIENEFKAIRATASQQNKDGMEITAKPVAREVHASYQLNELKMQIAVCLPANHPLGPVVVNTEKRAGVVFGQWRYWILQITSFLQYQNGGIIDGLLMWKEKVDKKFEGMEECMICFSLVHGSNQSLPKLKCKTCKKKYHAQCLYKWFDTSNNSTCPLCRSPMIFR